MSRRGNRPIMASVKIDLGDIDAGQFAGYLEGHIEELAKEVKAEAKASTAFTDRTGTLRKSIRIQTMRDADGEKIVVVGAFAPHAHLVEFGTQAPRRSDREGGKMFLDGVYSRKGRGVFVDEVGPMPARPFLRPALEKVLMRAASTVSKGE